jgi:hypothetical protein
MNAFSKSEIVVSCIVILAIASLVHACTVVRHGLAEPPTYSERLATINASAFDASAAAIGDATNARLMAGELDALLNRGRGAATSAQIWTIIIREYDEESYVEAIAELERDVKSRGAEVPTEAEVLLFRAFLQGVRDGSRAREN